MPEQMARDGQTETWLTLAELEPVANYLAARFAQEGVSTRKVQGIMEVLQYHCLNRQTEGLRVEFGLLGGWLTRSQGDFKDATAFDVLCAVLLRFADHHDAFPDPAERRELYRLLTNWLSVLNWKFKALSNKDKTLFNRVKQYANQMSQTTQAVESVTGHAI